MNLISGIGLCIVFKFIKINIFLEKLRITERPALFLYNSLTRKKDLFQPSNGNEVIFFKVIFTFNNFFRLNSIFVDQLFTILRIWAMRVLIYHLILFVAC